VFREWPLFDWSKDRKGSFAEIVTTKKPILVAGLSTLAQIETPANTGILKHKCLKMPVFAGV
jgi:hypothetical protein